MPMMSVLLLLQLHVAPPGWRVLERTAVSWRSGAPPYELLLEESVPARDADPDHRIRIRVPGRPDFMVLDDRGPGAYVPLREALKGATPALARSLSDSERVLTLPGSGAGRSTIVGVIGYAYASEPYELTLIGFDAAGAPRLLFREGLDVTSITDLDGDGRPEIVGVRGLSEEVGANCTTTYDPFAVFRIGGARATYDLALSRRYNEAHYVWGGPETTDTLAVRGCTPAKRRLVRAPR